MGNPVGGVSEWVWVEDTDSLGKGTKWEKLPSDGSGQRHLNGAN
jgi:hypothetical protein